jgi:polyisoprenyl-teichoic acid--peptidoglycan teichoic acid transferase
MSLTRRRFLKGAALAVASGTIAAALRIGYEMNNALQDVDVMIVPTVSLPPTAASIAPTTLPGAPVPTAFPTARPTQQPTPNEPINILLLGTDKRPGEDVTRTDAMILVHVRPRDKRVGLLSIPRDLLVEIPGFGEARINAAYPIGERRLGAGYGGALAKETVQNLIGFPVHHFVLIDFDGFKKVIDTIGGIDINVTKPIYDPAYPTEDFQTKEVRFSEGLQHLDGERALIYARTRHADNDFGRNVRQQQVLMAMFEGIRSRGILTQLTSIDDYTAALRDYVRTDLSRDDMLRLARLAATFDRDSVERYAIGPDNINVLDTAGTFAADPEALRRVVATMTGTGSEVEPPR